MLAKLIGGGVALGIAAFGLFLFGNAREKAGRMGERAEWHQQLGDFKVRAAQQQADQALAWANQSAAAWQNLAATNARIEPVIVRAQSEVIRYAQTVDGATRCLPADRVREIDRDRAILFAAPASAPGSSADPVQPGVADALP